MIARFRKYHRIIKRCAHQVFCKSRGNLAMFAAIRRASSFVRSLAAGGVRTSQVSNIVTICGICVQEPSRLGCFSSGRTGICFSCRTERTGRTGDGLLRRLPDERRPRKRRAYWGTKAKPLGSRADGFAVLRLGI
jgi:hypothetical protein